MDMAGHGIPALTPQQIAAQSSAPIGSKSLQETGGRARRRSRSVSTI